MMKIKQSAWSQRVVDELATLGQTATVHESEGGVHCIVLGSASVSSTLAVQFTLDEPGLSTNKRWAFRILGDDSTRYRHYYARSVGSPDRLNAAEIAKVVVDVARRRRLEPQLQELNEQRGWTPGGILYFDVGRNGGLMLTMEVPVTKEQAHAMIAAAMACGVSKAAGAHV